MDVKPITLDPNAFGGSITLFDRLTLTKSFLLRDLGIPPRTFHMWKTSGLSPITEPTVKDADKREWVRLDFYQYLWLRMVKSLRNLGYPFEHIKKAREEFFAPVKIEVVDFLREQSPETIAHLLEFIGHGQFPKEIAHQVVDFLKDPTLLKDENPLSRPAIEMIVLNACQQKHSEFGCAFFEDGSLINVDWSTLMNFDQFDSDFSSNEVLDATVRKPHIYISITGIIREFITEEERKDGDLHTVLLSSEELNLIRSIRSKEFKTISIHYDKGKDSRIIKTEKEKKIKDAEVKRFIDEVIFAPNSKTTLTKTNNGELIINVTKTTKLTQ